MEHRPSTTPRNRTLFWAALAIPVQLVHCCFSSASVSRLQLLRGRSLFLSPCGFQVRDAGFLRVCPIQSNFLRSICSATGRICSDNCTCCHTEIEAADQTFYLTQSQYTDTSPTSPSTDPVTQGAWQGSHWSANFEVTGMTRPRKNPGASGNRTPDLPLSRRTP